jgi:N-dimethylarginine dimethylaminohydrolase
VIRTAPSEIAPLGTVLVKRPEEAFGSAERIEAEWRDLGYTAPPDYEAACAEHAAFVQLLQAMGAQPTYLPSAPDTGLDSLYARDASIVGPRGAILCRMGKEARRAEPEAEARAYWMMGVPVLGGIEAPGTVEGGDFVWLDERTAAVGRGYRTNAEGIRQLRELLADDVDRLLVVPLPHWRGPGDVFHLMSILSPVDRDLAVVYSPLLPVPFREALLERGIELVEVPDEEFDALGCNVLAVAPRRCVMVEGCPVTRRRLEAAGAEVRTFAGREICLKGQGGPTCLTRPVVRRTEGGPTG